MTYDEFQRHVRKAGLTLTAFADLVRMNRVSVSNYAKQPVVPAHLAIIAALLGELVDNGIDYRPVFSSIQISPKKARGKALGPRGFRGTPQRQFSLEGDVS